MTQLGHDRAPSYRPDIDGLRAIAVLAVVLFHIDPAWLSGGFAGVDIFFVISGYLITGNIIKDIRSPNGFSWAEFYRRRILRILPVLFVVLLVVLGMGQMIMLPADFQELARTTVAALLSGANAYFTYFLDTSYFADDSSLQPLLHLWPLGVEEQFYFIWPVVLVLLLGRFSRLHLILLSGVLAAVSFGLAQWLLGSQPMFAYYMLPTRAGELLIGAILAVYLSMGAALPLQRWAVLVGATGLLLILGSLLWITEDMGFPGITALPSTIGAALVILAGSGGVRGVSRLLALRPMVLVGLISYSLYLWHWPLLAFYRYVYGSPGVITGLLLLALMILLSIASYQLVEKPCRRLRWEFGQTMIRMFGGGMLIVGLCCAGVLLSRGFGLDALQGEYRARLSAAEPPAPAYKHSYVCQRPELTEKELRSKDCIINGVAEPKVLLWGDSNAAHFVGLVSSIAERAGFSFRSAAHSSCPPLLQGAEATQKPDRVARCLRSLKRVHAQLDQYSTVILGGAWSSYFGGTPAFGKLLEQTVDQLRARGKKVILLGQVPVFRDIDRKCAQKSVKLPMLNCEDTGWMKDYGETEFNRFLMSLVASRPDVGYFSIREQLCNGTQCNAYLDGKLMYYDPGHLSMDGSWVIGQRVASQGVPSAFAGIESDAVPRAAGSLRAELDTRQHGSPWPTDVSWVKLLDQSAGAWKGKARTVVEAEGLRVHDEDRQNFEHRYRLLSAAELQSVLQGHSQLLVRARVAACEGNPMLRVWLKGEVQAKFDAVIDCANARVLASSKLGDENVRLMRVGTDFEVSVRLPAPAQGSQVAVYIYPASARRPDQYDVDATGSVLVNQVDAGGAR